MDSKQRQAAIEPKQTRTGEAAAKNAPEQVQALNLPFDLNQGTIPPALLQQSNAQPLLQRAARQLQRQHGNSCLQRLLARPEGIIQRQEVPEEGECGTLYQEIRTAFVNQARTLDPAQVEAETQKFIEDLNHFKVNRARVAEKVKARENDLKISKERAETLLREAEHRTSEEFDAQYHAKLAELESQYEAKKLEVEGAKTVMDQKRAEFDGLVDSAIQAYQEFENLLATKQDLWASIDLQMTTEIAQGLSQPSTSLAQKLEAYKQTCETIKTKTEEWSQKDKENSAGYEKAGQAMEGAENEYAQKNSELTTIRVQLEEHQKSSLAATYEALRQEEARQQELEEAYKAAKKERKEYVDEQQIFTYFLHLKEFGVTDLAWVTNIIDKLGDCP